MTHNGIEYVTKEEAAARCRAFAAANPGSVFHNYAHDKVVRTADNRTTLYEWNKLYADVVKSNPELKGLWTLNTRYTQEAK
jgi:hypothetical protein